MNKIKASLICLLIISMNAIAAQESPPDPTFAVTEVKPGIFMLSGVGGFVGGNIALSLGDDGVIMIDDSMPPFVDKMKKAIKSVTSKPIDYLINTHVHMDHTGNNAVMGTDGAKIVAHENLRIHMLKKGLQTKDGKKEMPKSALPIITFTHEISFYMNNDTVKVTHAPHAHTDGDAIITFKNANVVHMGDTFFNGLFPFIDINNGGSVDGYINAQVKILESINDDTKIIPGHGPLATKNDLRKAVNMLIDAKKLIGYQIEKGKSEEDVVKANPLKKYEKQWSWEFITTEKMTRQVYKSLMQ